LILSQHSIHLYSRLGPIQTLQSKKPSRLLRDGFHY
jgi:hypothetical protein